MMTVTNQDCSIIASGNQRECEPGYCRYLSKISERSGESMCSCSSSEVGDPFAQEEKEEGKEDLYGWVVVFASFICIAVIDGVGYTTGLLLSSLLSDLGGGRGEVSFAGSLQVGVYSLSGPIVGRLVTDWGARPVCILGAIVSAFGMFAASFSQSLGAVLVGYSVITGVGFGLMYIPAVVGAAPYFNKRRALAIGMCLCGSGFGTFTLAPVSEAILTTYGWRWVFRFLSALCLVCVVCGLLMRPKNNPEDDLETPIIDEEVQMEKMRGIYRVMDPVLLDNPNISTFFLVMFSDFFGFIAIFIPYAHLPPLAVSRNISSADAAFLISAGGISNTFGRVMGGWFCDQPYLHPIYVMLISVFISGLPLLAIPRMSTYFSFMALFGLFGFSSGTMVGSTNPLLVKLLGVASLSQTFGLVTAMRGVAALMGPPLAGVLVDVYNDSGMALDLSGFLLILSSVTCLTAIFRYQFTRRRASYLQL